MPKYTGNTEIEALVGEFITNAIKYGKEQNLDFFTPRMIGVMMSTVGALYQNLPEGSFLKDYLPEMLKEHIMKNDEAISQLRQNEVMEKLKENI